MGPRMSALGNPIAFKFNYKFNPKMGPGMGAFSNPIVCKIRPKLDPKAQKAKGKTQLKLGNLALRH
jgi:hypothetical protein